MRKTNEKNERERLERMFQRLLDALIVVLAIAVTILGLKLIHKKSTMQSVSAPLGFIVCGEYPEALVEGGFSPIPPPPDDVNSPTELRFGDHSMEGEVFFELVPVLKPKVKPKRAIRRVVRNTDWEVINWEIDSEGH